MKTVTVGLVQMQCTADVSANQARAETRIRETAQQGARIICLQELFSTLYFCQQEDYRQFELAESVPGPTTQRFSRLAAELGVVLVVPLFERAAAGVYFNSAVVLDADGRMAGHYRKMHIPDDPGFEEKFYFSPGDLGFAAFDTRHGRVAVLICWDQWFPEAARLAAMDGAEVLFYPTAIGWHPDRPEEGQAYHDAWQISMRGHAVANGLYVAAVNRTGREGDLSFWGQSFVADPLGRLIVQGPRDAEACLVVPCDLGSIEAVRQEWPFFRDRRPEAYAGLQRRFGR
ncbi:MAG TPA: carbon-nitrogen hydrolase [Candidatus Xenobia bacterium]|jgi:N-carbamoylputrescine amidase